MYVITGATGRTGSAVAHALLSQARQVRVVGRSLKKLQSLVNMGAEPCVADPKDPEAMAAAFQGATAAWIMLQPNYIADSPDFRAFQDTVIASVVPALTRAGVKRVVSLSSWGADKAAGTGPVVGLHRLETALNALPDMAVLHLRAGYFMENTLTFIEPLLTGSDVAGPYQPELKLPMIATEDIGTAAADALLGQSFTGHSVRELHGERDLSMMEAAKIIGQAIGKPDARYIQISAADTMRNMLATGVSRNVAGLMMDVVEGINSGIISTTQPRSPETTTATSFETFVNKEFLPRYKEAHKYAWVAT